MIYRKRERGERGGVERIPYICVSEVARASSVSLRVIEGVGTSSTRRKSLRNFSTRVMGQEAQDHDRGTLPLATSNGQGGSHAASQRIELWSISRSWKVWKLIVTPCHIVVSGLSGKALRCISTYRTFHDPLMSSLQVVAQSNATPPPASHESESWMWMDPCARGEQRVDIPLATVTRWWDKY